MGAAVFVSAAILQKAMEVAGCHTTYRDDDAYEVVVEEDSDEKIIECGRHFS